MRILLLTMIVGSTVLAEPFEPPRLRRLGKLAEGSKTTQYTHPSSLSADGTKIAVRVREGFDIVDLKTGKVATLRDPTGKLIPFDGPNRYKRDAQLAFMPGTNIVVTVNRLAAVHLWDATTGKLLRVVKVATPIRLGGETVDRPEPVYYAVAQPAKKGVALIGTRVFLLTADDKVKQVRRKGFDDGMRHWSSDGRWVAMAEEQASIENMFTVYDLNHPTKKIDGEVSYTGYAGPVCPSEDGKFIAATFWDSSSTPRNGVVLFTSAGKQIPLDRSTNKFDIHTARRVYFSKDSTRLYCDYKGRLGVWETATGRRLPDLVKPRKGTVEFDHVGGRVLIVADEGVFQWNLAKSKKE